MILVEENTPRHFVTLQKCHRIRVRDSNISRSVNYEKEQIFRRALNFCDGLPVKMKAKCYTMSNTHIQLLAYRNHIP